MLATYILCFSVHLFSGYAQIVDDRKMLRLAEMLQIMFTMLSVLMQFYFIIQLKRVRAWLESSKPVELEVKLASVKANAWVISVLFVSFFLTYGVEYFWIRDMRDISISYMVSIVYDVQMAFLMGMLIYISVD